MVSSNILRKAKRQELLVERRRRIVANAATSTMASPLNINGGAAKEESMEIT